MKRFIIKREELFFETISPTGRPVWVDLKYDTCAVAIYKRKMAEIEYGFHENHGGGEQPALDAIRGL